MLIHKVILNNFRQYYGRVQLNFSTLAEKNVTIIHGENGVGKTALLNAIKWGFFGTVTSNFRNPTNLVNDVAQKNGKLNCIVEIEFEEDNRRFLLKRTYDQKTLKSTLTIFEEENSVWGASMPEPELVINSMLPKEMAEYFFFQGEGSNAVDTGNKQGNLAKSIRDILGFKVAESLSDTLRKLISETRSKIAQLDISGESKSLSEEIERDERSLAIYQKRNNDSDEIIPALEKKHDQIETELALINNQDLKKLRNEERNAEIELKKLQNEHESLQKRRYSTISKFGWAVFGAEFANDSLDFIDESQLKGRLPEPYNRTFIEDIISNGICICGECLEVGSEGYKKITAMLDKAANPLLLQRLSGIRAQIQDINTLNSIASDEIANLISQYDANDERVQAQKLKLKNIDEQIKAIPEEKINHLQKTKRDVYNDLKNQIEIQATAKIKIEELKSRISKNVKKLDSLTPRNDLTLALTKKQRFIEHLNSFLTHYLADIEQKIRLHVVIEVNKTLDKFSRHDFKIKVSEKDFRIFLKDKNDNDVGQGDGLNLLLNLTITASLISFAAKRKKVRDPILNSATVAPLVIDAPFGVLDQRYRNVVVTELPKFANQVVFLVSSSQWTDEMDSHIRHLIGSEYCLVLEESSPQNERIIDKKYIAGKEVILSRYDCDIDRTVVEEIK
ncbi:MAG: AAA family ATPase [Gammaproteobacteria bacterium]